MTDSRFTVEWCLGMIAAACGAVALNDWLRGVEAVAGVQEPEGLVVGEELVEAGEEIQPWEVVGWVEVGAEGKVKAYWCCEHAWGKKRRKGLRKVRFAQVDQIRDWGCAAEDCAVEW